MFPGLDKVIALGQQLLLKIDALTAEMRELRREMEKDRDRV